jgi:hypothetical protein
LAEHDRDDGKTLLLITSQQGLLSAAGKEDVDRVFRLIGRLAEARRESGFLTGIYVPDNPRLSSDDFPSIEGTVSPEAVRDGISAIEKGPPPGGRLDYVLIIGDGGVIPYWRLANPAADSDEDFPTDVPYSVAEETEGEGGEPFLLPDRAVARLPLNAGAGGALEATLEAMSDAGRPLAHPDRHFGLCALQWKNESSRVYSVLSKEGLRTSPPVDIDSFSPEWLEAAALIYFNVHGSRDHEYWYGQQGFSYPKVLSPGVVSAASPSDAIVFSEACYGGLVDGKTPQDSVAMSFLAKRVSAFIGSSAIAYGSPDVKLTEADLLAYLFFKHLVEGETTGVALREAKVDFAAAMLERQGFLDGDDRKTLLEFNLFGDPTVGIYKGIGPKDRSREMVSEEVLAGIKKIAAQRFPEMAGVEPEVSERKDVSGGAVAGKVASLRPGSAAKAGPRPPGRVFVASFRHTIAVGEREIERVVRVTFLEDGHVMKVVTSK